MDLSILENEMNNITLVYVSKDQEVNDLKLPKNHMFKMSKITDPISNLTEIKDKNHICISGSDFETCCLFYWSLRIQGFQNVSIFDGDTEMIKKLSKKYKERNKINSTKQEEKFHFIDDSFIVNELKNEKEFTWIIPFGEEMKSNHSQSISINLSEFFRDNKTIKCKVKLVELLCEKFTTGMKLIVSCENGQGFAFTILSLLEILGLKNINIYIPQERKKQEIPQLKQKISKLEEEVKNLK
jgi:3-mercaptopyruvate sulfurtransferase SseA